MAAITWANVTAFASSLTTIDPDAQADIIATVNSWFNVRVWGGEDAPKLKMARIFLAAHFAELGPRRAASGAGGSVQSETISDSSFRVDYSTLGTDEALRLTNWGASLLSLRGSNAKSRIPGAL